MAHLDEFESTIRQLIEKDHLTYCQVSEYLQGNKLIQHGASERSIRRFCHDHNISARVPECELSQAISQAIDQVGPTFGRKMMTGYLCHIGVSASERRVGRLMQLVHEPYHKQRQKGAKNLNPIPYHAEYFGHKLHMDQNEKLVMFGAVHVMAVDGLSGKIVAWTSMPMKNNYRIYDEVYRAAVRNYGMWDQLRVDHGTEFYLSLYVQERNAHLRRNVNRQPYIQTESKRNHKIERVWPEVNQRVNYPIKGALVEMVDNEAIDLDDDLVKFCVSSLCVKVSHTGLEQVVGSWNAHRVPCGAAFAVISLAVNNYVCGGKRVRC